MRNPEVTQTWERYQGECAWSEQRRKDEMALAEARHQDRIERARKRLREELTLLP